jgi:hypothetical protein
LDGQSAAFIKEPLPLSPAETEEKNGEQAQAILKLKSYLE